jgi:adenylylsulfate kinase
MSTHAHTNGTDTPSIRHAPDAGAVVWFTGLSGAGKSTIATAVAARLRARDFRVEILDGDEIRTNLSAGLGFSKADRDTNVQRVGYVAALLAAHGVIVLAALVSPYRDARDAVRTAVTRRSAHFVEIFVDAHIALCAERDVKGLYARALAGEIPHFTGVSDPYEPPVRAELTIATGAEPVEASATRVLHHLVRLGFPLGDPAYADAVRG